MSDHFMAHLAAAQRQDAASAAAVARAGEQMGELIRLSRLKTQSERAVPSLPRRQDYAMLTPEGARAYYLAMSAYSAALAAIDNLSEQIHLAEARYYQCWADAGLSERPT